MGTRRDRGSKDRVEREGFLRRFEDAETLQGLLELAGSELDTAEVERRFRVALAQGEVPSQVIPTLFAEEPRFPDPSYAQRLFSNLFGLWDLVAKGKPVARSTEEKSERVRQKKQRPEPPPPPDGEPDERWVAAGVDYLARVEGKDRMRLEHAFENRQDALLALLDEEGLSDGAYLVARRVLWELFSLVELGRPVGAGSVDRKDVSPTAPLLPAPEALWAHAQTALDGADERARLLPLVQRALGALWRTTRVDEGS